MILQIARNAQILLLSLGMVYVKLALSYDNIAKSDKLPAPSVVFGFVLATLYSTSFHFLLGGDARRLALFILAGWIGFALGQILGDLMNLDFAGIGPLNFCPATSGAYLALLVVLVLTRRNPLRS